ncbi:MAG: acylneuraminate cytidylyltransferase family protein [Verrucomicrobiae bacterium]|nr:acylneuraminate cytidylyltransferase family protein [Verrucomicrobiae bacterium]
MSIAAFIFARGGSKGLPGKNLRLLGGRPLIAWSISQALAVKRISKVIVSTDSTQIAEVAREYGAEVPFLRPKELASDESPEWLSWQHALNYVNGTSGKLDAMVSLPCTAPLRIPSDVDRCLDRFEAGDVDCVIAVTESHRSPFFNMVKLKSDGTVGLVNPPRSAIARRQDAPEVYDMTTVAYVVRPSFVLSRRGIFEGRVASVIVPRERSIDIDTLLDFQIAECLLNSISDQS